MLTLCSYDKWDDCLYRVLSEVHSERKCRYSCFETGLNTVQCKHVSKHHMVTYKLPDKINLIKGVIRDKGHHACICHWCLYVANTEKTMGIGFKIKQLPA